MIDVSYLEDILAAGGGKRHIIAISPFPKFIMPNWKPKIQIIFSYMPCTSKITKIIVKDGEILYCIEV
jgi:hypothetical protein